MLDKRTTPTQAVLAAERGEYVREAVASLPDRERLMVEGVFLEGNTLTTTAEKHGRNLSTAKANMQSALRRLRQRLKPKVRE